MTKREMFNLIATTNANNAEIVAFCDHEIELLSKKSSKSGLTKTQKENIEIKAKLLKALAEVGSPVTITEFQAASEVASQYSNNKISALFRQLRESGEVVRVVEKKKSYFSVTTSEGGDEVTKEELDELIEELED